MGSHYETTSYSILGTLHGDVVGLFPDIKQVHLIHSASVDRSIATYDLKMERKLVRHQTANGVLCGLSQRKDHEEELGKHNLTLSELRTRGSYLFLGCG